MCLFVCLHLVPEAEGLSCIFQLQTIGGEKHDIWVHQFRRKLVLESGFQIKYLTAEFSLNFVDTLF